MIAKIVSISPQLLSYAGKDHILIQISCTHKILNQDARNFLSNVVSYTGDDEKNISIDFIMIILLYNVFFNLCHLIQN